MKVKQSIKLCMALLPLLLLLGFIEAAEKKIQPRIVGGSATTVARVPYIVNLRQNGRFFCGGTLVSRRFVVTAAHCMRGVSRSSLTVVGGETTLNGSGQTRRVSKIMVPRAFSLSTMNMDVAVLKLASSMGGRSRPIGLCTSSWKVGEQVSVSGWGLTSESSNTVPNQVRTVSVPLLKKSTCARLYRSEARLTSTMFCAALPGRKDACTGDSGGPVVFKGQLCGIVSWGVGCARRRFPGVYTNIKSVRSFIRAAMRK